MLKYLVGTLAGVVLTVVVGFGAFKLGGYDLLNPEQQFWITYNYNAMAQQLGACKGSTI